MKVSRDMRSRDVMPALALVAVAMGAVIVRAQTLSLPQNPPRTSGASINPVFEGWFDNPDGTHGFSIGYYNRNTEQAVDIPIGPGNHFEPGDPDRGQPTHFLPGRHYGLFVVTVPKDFGKSQQLTWALTANGQTFGIPFYMSHPEYNVSPFKASEQGADGFNTPPVLRFLAKSAGFAGPGFNVAAAPTRSATVGVPMGLDLWADDDALYQNATSVPLSPSSTRAPVTVFLSKYRGPGDVVFADPRPRMQTLQGGKPDQPYSGRTSTTMTFTEAGDYMVHVLVNDYSGSSDSNCCWTNAVVKVNVSGASLTHASKP
jgi:hypothetical protein